MKHESWHSLTLSPLSTTLSGWGSAIMHQSVCDRWGIILVISEVEQTRRTSVVFTQLRRNVCVNDTGVLCFTKPFLLIVCVDLDSKDCGMNSINYYFLLSGGHIVVLHSTKELRYVITLTITYHGNRIPVTGYFTTPLSKTKQPNLYCLRENLILLYSSNLLDYCYCDRNWLAGSHFVKSVNGFKWPPSWQHFILQDIF